MHRLKDNTTCLSNTFSLSTTESQEELKILRHFLNMPISASDEIFSYFRTLPGVIEAHGDSNEGYLYIPGIREDRCLLVAHADTYFDRSYTNMETTNHAVLERGVYHGTNPTCSIGADDRCGCAIVWILRDLGHSILILDGEEHGHVGARFLKDHNPELFEEINDHSYILEFDRRGAQDLIFYDLPVTDAFITYIQEQTGYSPVYSPSSTDIVMLCEKICGVNLSVGYYDEHSSDEIVVTEEWKATLSTARQLLKQPQKQYKLESINPYLLEGLDL